MSQPVAFVGFVILMSLDTSLSVPTAKMPPVPAAPVTEEPTSEAPEPEKPAESATEPPATTFEGKVVGRSLDEYGGAMPSILVNLYRCTSCEVHKQDLGETWRREHSDICESVLPVRLTRVRPVGWQHGPRLHRQRRSPLVPPPVVVRRAAEPSRSMSSD